MLKRKKLKSKSAVKKSVARPKPAAQGRGSARRSRSRAARTSAGQWFEKLMALQRRLRAPDGCPWDREQSHASIRKYLVEETYEVLDAMDSPDPAAFPSELGDLLLQVVFHSVLAEEAGRFSVSDVIESVHTKMVRRHPHVFGDVLARTSADVLKNWEQIKAAERAEAQDKNANSPTRERKSAAASKQFSLLKAPIGASESLLSDESRSLPAVLEACQLTRSASRVGFDWDSLSGVLDKLAEESQELVAARNEARSSAALDPRVEEEAGDLLFAAVNAARFLGVDPEIALKRANRKFRSRFRFMERSAAAQGRRFADVPRPQMEELWNASKKRDADKSPGFSE